MWIALLGIVLIGAIVATSSTSWMSWCRRSKLATRLGRMRRLGTQTIRCVSGRPHRSTAAARAFFSKSLDAMSAEPDEVYVERLGEDVVAALSVGRPFPMMMRPPG